MSVSQSDLDPSEPVEAVSGVGESRGRDLRDAGYETVEDLQRANVGELTKHVRPDLARSIKDQVGNVVQRLTTAAQARDQAQNIPGAVAKVVRGPNGKQVPKVLEKVEESHEPGATIEIHKG